jgi:hypothetical protein
MDQQPTHPHDEAEAKSTFRMICLACRHKYDLDIDQVREEGSGLMWSKQVNGATVEEHSIACPRCGVRRYIEITVRNPQAE